MIGSCRPVGCSRTASASGAPASPRWPLHRFCSRRGRSRRMPAAWLARAATAARALNYVGTIVYQHGGRVETSRIVHWNDGGVRV